MGCVALWKKRSILPNAVDQFMPHTLMQAVRGAKPKLDPIRQYPKT